MPFVTYDIKVQDSISDPALSFAFDADDLVKTAALGVAGVMANLQVTVPVFTNPNLTITPSIKTAADGETVWEGPALPEGTVAAIVYQLDSNPTYNTYWSNQIVKATYVLVMTLSGVAGGTGGTVTAIPRVVGS